MVMTKSLLTGNASKVMGKYYLLYTKGAHVNWPSFLHGQHSSIRQYLLCIHPELQVLENSSIRKFM